MKMKRILVTVLACAMALGIAACGKAQTSGEAKSDMEYVKNKGRLVVGITSYAPMDYTDANGEWIGFDADMARAFGESLGVEVEFVEITWDNKVAELNGKTIDCVWNGMTLLDEVTSAMSCSNAYCNNQQIVVVLEENAEKYSTLESIKDLRFAVEGGSAGRDVAEDNNFKYTEVTAQSDALMEVASGTSDAAIIDSLMAGAMIGEGTSYSKLTYTVRLSDEKYGVGFRKGSDLTEELNKFFKKSYEDGSMQKCAEKYGVQEALIEQ